MTPDTDKLVRQLSLVAYLMAERRSASARDVKQAVEGYSEMSDEAFARRFYADRSELLALGVPLQSQRDDFTGEELYTLLQEHYFLPPLDLNDAELAALSTAVHLLDGQFAYAEPLRLALQNLALGRPNPSYDAAPEVSVRLLGSGFTAEVADPAAEARDRDLEAAHRRLPLLGDLLRRGGRAHGRPLQPLPHGRAVVRDRPRPRPRRRAHLPPRPRPRRRALRDAPRARLPRAARVRPERLPQPRALAARRERRASRRSSSSPRPPGSPSAPSASTARVEHRDDRSLLYTTPVRRLAELAGWLIGLDGLASPLSPPELVERVAAALERVAADHEGEPAAARGAARAGRPGARRPSAASRPSRPSASRCSRRCSPTCWPPAASSKDAIIDAAELAARFKLSDEELEDHLQLLNLVNFGGGCYAVYAERVDEGRTIHVEKELYGDEFRRPARLSPLEAKALLLALDLVGPLVAADCGHRARRRARQARGRLRPLRHARCARRRSRRRSTRTCSRCSRRPCAAASVVEIEYLGRQADAVERARRRAALPARRARRLVLRHLGSHARRRAHVPRRPHPRGAARSARRSSAARA